MQDDLMVSSQNTNHLFNDPTSFLPPSYPAHSIAFPQFPSSHGAGPPPPTRPVPTGSSSRTSLNYVPDASFVNPTVASLSMRRFIAHILSLDGYRAAEPDAMSRLELEVISFIENLFGLAKCFAELSGRTMPTAEDMLSACEELNTDFMSLRKHSKSYKKELNSTKQSTLVPPLSTSSTPELLSSDDEGAPLVVPPTLRSLPSHLPTLPPKHTYLRTPIPPPKKQALPSLEKKLENAALVQDSLKNLLLSTEDSAGQEDGELFGGVVNWKMTRHPRKKWKYHG